MYFWTSCKRFYPYTTQLLQRSLRETALWNWHVKTEERLKEYTQHLLPLKVADSVRIQNQTGRHPLKWDKIGQVIEVHQFDQYAIHVDGSGGIILHDRKFFHCYTPVYEPAVWWTDLEGTHTPNVPQLNVPLMWTKTETSLVSPMSTRITHQYVQSLFGAINHLEYDNGHEIPYPVRAPCASPPFIIIINYSWSNVSGTATHSSSNATANNTHTYTCNSVIFNVT